MLFKLVIQFYQICNLFNFFFSPKVYGIDKYLEKKAFTIFHDTDVHMIIECLIIIENWHLYFLELLTFFIETLYMQEVYTCNFTNYVPKM